MSTPEHTTNDSAAGNSRFFYGWLVVVAAGLVMFSAGNFQYTFGIFVKPLINNFGWSRATISASISIRNVFSAVTAPVAGTLSDRFGAKKFILAGIILIGASYMLASRMTSVWQLYLFMGVIMGLGMSMVVSPTVATASGWFGGRSAAANGMVYAGFGLAQMVIPPLGTSLIVNYGLDVCFAALGGLTWVVGGAMWFIIKKPPASSSSKVVDGLDDVPGMAKDDEESYQLSEMLRSSAMWKLLIICTVMAICYQTVIIHIVASARDAGIAAGPAAIILTLSGITNTAGRLLVSVIGRKVSHRTVLITSIAVQAAVLFLLAGTSELYLYYLVTTVYGFAYGSLLPLIPTIAADYFGTDSLGSIVGLQMFSYTTGAAIGPFAAGYIFDVTGSYYIAFISAAVAMSMAFLFSLTLKPPRKI